MYDKHDKADNLSGYGRIEPDFAPRLWDAKHVGLKEGMRGQAFLWDFCFRHPLRLL
jgi:hypothetical protein